ncbi:MAG: hypothetical protein HGA96_08355 [Desulfobulbaceae bacterium]|nr:hypothetical protein [Desulfobulbaceae bacterium]
MIHNQQLVIFQENGSGEKKLAGLRRFGRDMQIIAIYNIDAALPAFIDNPEAFIPADFSGDLALSFLKHPDLINYLAQVCASKALPLIASGKKEEKAITPFTCCGLGRMVGLGAYGEQFGFPELTITAEHDRISRIEVVRGASCGATWLAASRVIGLPLPEALITYPREVQYLCVADPAAFDPISGKSSVHYAGHVHAAALKKAAKQVLAVGEITPSPSPLPA